MYNFNLTVFLKNSALYKITFNLITFCVENFKKIITDEYLIFMLFEGICQIC